MAEFQVAYEQAVDNLLEIEGVLRGIRVVLEDQNGKETAVALLNESADYLGNIIMKVETMYALHVRGEKEPEPQGSPGHSAALPPAA